MKTWAEFKQEVEKQGVKDDDCIRYIDISGWDIESGVHFFANDTWRDKNGEIRRTFSVS